MIQQPVREDNGAPQRSGAPGRASLVAGGVLGSIGLLALAVNMFMILLEIAGVREKLAYGDSWTFALAYPVGTCVLIAQLPTLVPLAVVFAVLAQRAPPWLRWGVPLVTLSGIGLHALAWLYMIART